MEHTWTKQALIQCVRERRAELIELVSRLIQIKSENPTGSQEEVIAFVENYLTQHGLSCEKVCFNADFPCVLAQYGTEDGFSFLINGHVDVVPAGERSKWNFDPYCGTITDKEILGRGTSDMKAGIACALFTLALLNENQVPLRGNIRLHIVSDEESGGQFGSECLCRHGYAANADACLVAEPTGMDTIEIGQKGGLILTLRAYGESAHGSLGNFKGDNAILKLAKVLEHIDKLTRISGNFTERQLIPLADSKRFVEEKNQIPGVGAAIDHVTTNIGLISGGTRPNVVPDYCEATVDCRLPIGVNKEEIRSCLEEIIAESGVSGIEYTLDYRSDANYTDHEAAIVTAFRRNGEALLGQPVIPAYQWASSDAKFYRSLGIPTIQFGPCNALGIHSANETVNIADVAVTAEIYMGAICDLMGIPEKAEEMEANACC